jgi:hypothetical protein
LDAELPAYCRNQVDKKQILKNYKFFVKEEPHAHWDSFMCKTWLKTKKIDGFFFGGFDTVFITSVRSVTEQEFWKMVQYHRCHGNQMRGDTDVFSFTASPEGEGAWMQSKTYGTVNCLLQRLTLRKDCSNCPITSTIGLISNNSGISLAHHHDALIVWDASRANISSKCIVTEVKKVQA